MADKKTKKDATEKKAKGSKKEAAKAPAEKEIRIKARLADAYKAEIIPEMRKKFGYKSIMQVPKLNKIVINMGVGDAVADQKSWKRPLRNSKLLPGKRPVLEKPRRLFLTSSLEKALT